MYKDIIIIIEFAKCSSLYQPIYTLNLSSLSAVNWPYWLSFQRKMFFSNSSSDAVLVEYYVRRDRNLPVIKILIGSFKLKYIKQKA